MDKIIRVKVNKVVNDNDITWLKKHFRHKKCGGNLQRDQMFPALTNKFWCCPTMRYIVAPLELSEDEITALEKLTI